VASRTSQTKRQQIEAAPLGILEQHPHGVGYAELESLIQQAHPGAFNAHTADGTMWNLDRKYPDRVAKPERGLFILQQFRETAGPGGEDKNRGGWEHDELRREVEADTPLGRWGQPQDIAPAVRFFLSEDARFITGQTLLVDGGKGL